MRDDFSRQLAQIAGLIGEETRASILLALMAGHALTAGELALRANISPQATSNHLSKLLEAGMVTCHPHGRHRYYRLASVRVARAIENLGLIVPEDWQQLPRQPKVSAPIRKARTCYDHIAGQLGVAIADAMLERGYLMDNHGTLVITPEGEAFLPTWDIDVQELDRCKRPLICCCIDWTERKYHVAGRLGKAILDHGLEKRWWIQSKRSRALQVTHLGWQRLHRDLGVTGTGGP